jgi:hypothetical protein
MAIKGAIPVAFDDAFPHGASVALPAITVKAVISHLDAYTSADEDALVFTDADGGPLHHPLPSRAIDARWNRTRKRPRSTNKALTWTFERAGDEDRTRIASLEAVETVGAVAADLRLVMTIWSRDPEGCLRLWPVRGP